MSATQKPVVLLDNLDWEDGEGTLEFRLTYDGLLLASNTGRDERAARKAYKHTLRKRFHPQLKARLKRVS